MSRERRIEMIKKDHQRLSIVKQCKILGISRSLFYYQHKGEDSFNLKLMRIMDKQYLVTPWYGSRQMTRHLRLAGYKVNRKRVRRLFHLMGLKAVYPRRPKTSQPGPEHKIYPYLLRGLEINRPDQVWCADITYIPLQRGFMYLVAIMDWHTRKVLSWQLSNTMDTEFCVSALEDALSIYGRPEIFNTDQGSQFTSLEFTDVLKERGVRISMDGKGRFMDNIFIERLWRTLKYECIYLEEFIGGHMLKSRLSWWFNYYNQRRPHSALSDQTPDQFYSNKRRSNLNQVKLLRTAA